MGDARRIAFFISCRYKSVSDIVQATGEDTIIGIFLIKAGNLDSAIEIATRLSHL